MGQSVRYVVVIDPGSANPGWIAECFNHHFRTCIDAINNIAYVQIGIGDEKQSG